MGRLFHKKYRWEPDVVNELTSCRQFLDGKAPKDNERFVGEVLNRAVRYSLRNHPLFKAVTEVDEADRTFGKFVEIRVSRENWLDIQEKLNQMACMNESDILQFCVKHYLEIVKTRKSLPEDSAYGLEERVAQLQP